MILFKFYSVSTQTLPKIFLKFHEISPVILAEFQENFKNFPEI